MVQKYSTTTTSETQLRRDVEKILTSRFDDETAAVLAYVCVKYPYCRPEKLPETVAHDIDRSPHTLSVDEIRSQLEQVIEETDIFAMREDTTATGLASRLEPGTDDAFVPRLRQLLGSVPDGAPEPDDVLKRLRVHHQDYLEQRAESRVQRISIATSQHATETFKSDLDLEAYETPDELCIIAFSFETLPDFVTDSIRRWIKNGQTVKLLLYSKRVGERLESSRVRTAIQQGSTELKQLQSELAQDPGTLRYRFIVKPEHTYFRGLLVRSTSGESSYRLFVLDNERERGVNATILRGRGETTIYKILDEYFTDVWQSARPPGIRGFIQRNRVPLGFGLAVVLFLVGIYSWVSGLTSQRLSEIVISVTLGVIVTLAERVYRHIFL